MVVLYIRLSLEDEDVRKCTKEESKSMTNQRGFLKKYLSEHEEFAGLPFRVFLMTNIRNGILNVSGIGR